MDGTMTWTGRMKSLENVYNVLIIFNYFHNVYHVTCIKINTLEKGCYFKYKVLLRFSYGESYSFTYPLLLLSQSVDVILYMNNQC